MNKQKRIGKVIPGLSLTSKDIRSRLRNRTIQPEHYDNSAYIQSEELIAIQKMNKVEREMAARQNQKEIEEIQSRLDKTLNAKKAKQEEQRIDKLANDRLKQLRDVESAKNKEV